MKRTILLVIGMLAWLVPVAAAPAYAAPLEPDLLDAIDIDPATVVSTDVIGDPDAVGILNIPALDMPSKGSTALILSTGLASDAYGDPEDFASTDLAGSGGTYYGDGPFDLNNATFAALDPADGGADGNDLTQVIIELQPPSTATCVGFDFVFASEEFPEYVGTTFNDIFTAELNESFFFVDQVQVIAPNNFVYDAQGNLTSINTLFGIKEATELVYDGHTPALSAISPIETDLSTGTMDLIFTIQDLGDSVFDSAVIIDNLRWLSGTSCDVNIEALTDSDGDGLSDVWETEGIDYDGDGVPEVDLPAMGADPEHKDIFIEVDWMVKEPTCVWIICWGGQDFGPSQDAIDDVIESFADAPVSNPDGVDGVTLHIDTGPTSIMDPNTGATWGAMSGANSVDHDEELGEFDSSNRYDWTEFLEIKADNFEPLRRDAFHYALYADMLEDTSISGISRGIPASDFIVSDGGWGGFTLIQERGTFQHEFGHNLNLWHGGGEGGTLNYDTSYESVMNYEYQMSGVPADNRTDFSDGAPYDDWSNLRFDGGSVGDLGEAAPLPLLTEADSLDLEEAIANDVLALDGDGRIDAIGPTVLFVDEPNQVVAVDVTNVSSVDATYSVVSSESAISGAGPVTVAAGATMRIDLAVDSSAVTVGTINLEVQLSGLNQILSNDEMAIAVQDLSDPATAAAAEAARLSLQDDPPDGLDAAVSAAVLDVLTDALFPPQDCDGKTVTIDMRTNGGDGMGTSGDDVILGTDGNDTIDGLGGNDTVCGLGGNDRIVGGDGDDKLIGGDGNDIIRGNPGVDIIAGGAGNDRLLGGIGGDTISGNEGDDYIGGFGGADTISGGAGADTIFGGFGADDITAGTGDDEVRGLVGNDVIRGGDGNDRLYGDRGIDSIDGGNGNDKLFGGNSNDTLDGQGGDDEVNGGKADDFLSGGSGVDVCTGNAQNVADTADATCEAIFGVP